MSSTGVVFYLNIDFLPKVSSRFHVTQPIEVPAMHGEVVPGLDLLCVRRALKFYLLRSANFRGDDDVQFFLAMVGQLGETPFLSSKFPNGWWR